MGAGGVDDGARDNRTDEGSGGAEDVEEGEEEKFFAARCHFGDLICSRERKMLLASFSRTRQLCER